MFIFHRLEDGIVQWQEMIIMMRRNVPQSLVILPRAAENPRSSRSVETGRTAPPPMTVGELHEVADGRIGDRHILHSDGAQAYFTECAC